uniref:Uncharacterized protein n=1 Tax=Anguilla anguilla TaxID=7936 RepID=A0A0E9T2V9_ANGAN
MKQTVLLNV